MKVAAKTGSWHVSELAIAQVCEVLRRHPTRRVRDFQVPVGYHQVWPAVQFPIDKLSSPPFVKETKFPQSGLPGHIVKKLPLPLKKEIVCLVSKVCDKQVKQAIAIYVTGGDSHAGVSVAFVIET